MTSSVAATLHGPEDLRMVESALEPLAPGMVRVRFGAGGICGSDMHYFRHARTGDFVVRSPLVLGHEVAGEVVEIAGKAPGLAVGDRVAVNPSRWCGHCARCREGRANLCENIYFMGSASKTPHMQGGFASLFDATPQQCVKVPSSLPYAAAALAEPLVRGFVNSPKRRCGDGSPQSDREDSRVDHAVRSTFMLCDRSRARRKASGASVRGFLAVTIAITSTSPETM